jgi:hypothetical protein
MFDASQWSLRWSFRFVLFLILRPTRFCIALQALRLMLSCMRSTLPTASFTEYALIASVLKAHFSEISCFAQYHRATVLGGHKSGVEHFAFTPDSKLYGQASFGCLR